MRTGMTAPLSKGEAKLLWKRAKAKGVRSSDRDAPNSDEGRLLLRKPYDNARLRMVWASDGVPESICMEWCRQFGYPVSRLTAEDFL